jgi:hypothetical protein
MPTVFGGKPSRARKRLLELTEIGLETVRFVKSTIDQWRTLAKAAPLFLMGTTIILTALSVTGFPCQAGTK